MEGAPGPSAIVDAIDRALSVLGVDLTSVVHYGVGMVLDGDDEIVVATDLGLVQIFVKVLREGNTPAEDRVELRLELCPWSDVINPEMSARVVTFGDDRPNLEVKVLVQVPRISLSASDYGGPESRTTRLGALGAAILKAKG